MNIPCLHVHHRVLYLCPVISSHPDGSSPFSHTSIPYYLGRLERLHVIQRLGGTSIHVGLIVKKLIQAPARPGNEDYSASLSAWAIISCLSHASMQRGRFFLPFDVEIHLCTLWKLSRQLEIELRLIPGKSKTYRGREINKHNSIKHSIMNTDSCHWTCVRYCKYYLSKISFWLNRTFEFLYDRSTSFDHVCLLFITDGRSDLFRGGSKADRWGQLSRDREKLRIEQWIS